MTEWIIGIVVFISWSLVVYFFGANNPPKFILKKKIEGWKNTLSNLEKKVN